jgi:hypothetical protein
MRSCGKGFVAALQAKLAAIGFALAKDGEGLSENAMNALFEAERQEWEDKAAATERMKQRLAEIWKTLE